MLEKYKKRVEEIWPDAEHQTYTNKLGKFDVWSSKGVVIGKLQEQGTKYGFPAFAFFLQPKNGQNEKSESKRSD